MMSFIKRYPVMSLIFAWLVYSTGMKYMFPAKATDTDNNPDTPQ